MSVIRDREERREKKSPLLRCWFNDKRSGMRKQTDFIILRLTRYRFRLWWWLKWQKKKKKRIGEMVEINSHFLFMGFRYLLTSFSRALCFSLFLASAQLLGPLGPLDTQQHFLSSRFVISKSWTLQWFQLFFGDPATLLTSMSNRSICYAFVATHSKLARLHRRHKRSPTQKQSHGFVFTTMESPR